MPRSLLLFALPLLVIAYACTPAPETEPAAPPSLHVEQEGSTHGDLLSFFDAWTAFRRPPLVDGVPDYSADAMAAQYAELPVWMARLASFDTTGWSVAERVDWHLVMAEMNGLEFDHRVLRPWVNNPAFYVQIWTSQSDTPSHEGPTPEGFIDLWTYDLPLTGDAAVELASRIRTIPPFLERARTNLTGNQKDLWTMGVKALEGQRRDLERFAVRVEGTSTDLGEAIAAATDASASFAEWLLERAPSRTGPSGVGRDEYTWYLKNVHLSPYSWEDEVRIVEAELARSYTALRLEEQRNRDLPTLEPIPNAAEYDRRVNQAVDDYVAFLERADIMEPKPYMAPALRARVGRFSPASGPRSFFSEVDYRDPRTMRVHGTHWIDLARMQVEPHPSPIRALPLSYNIWDSRSEGLATAMEEFSMHAGLFDDSPRSRELIWILVAQRAARALAGLRMHSNEWTLDEAVAFAARWTPRGWMQATGDLVWFEQHLYLMQPGYGPSYLTGKAQIEELLSARQHQLGDAFTVRGFFDDMNAKGLIPVSLIRWEMTGDAESYGNR